MTSVAAEPTREDVQRGWIRHASDLRVGQQQGRLESEEARRRIRRSLHRIWRSAGAIFDDEEHSVDELREIVIGHSTRQRLLVVSFTHAGQTWFDSLAPGKLRSGKERTMKKAPDRKATGGTSDELQAEYRFDYSKAKPNRFASRVDPTRLVVALDPDVAEVFTTPDAVNKILRALIQTMPTKKKARGRA